MEGLGESDIADHGTGNFLKETELLFRMFEPGFQLFEAGHRRTLSQISASLRHHDSKNMIDAGRIAGAESLKPFEYVGIETNGHEFLGWTAEQAELLVGERWNIGVIDLGSA
jgi:hypothetical protein